MQFIKLQPQKLFDGYNMLENKVLILDEDENIEEIMDAGDAGQDIVNIEGILSPGFINCHCHVELSHLKNEIPENMGLATFVQQIVSKRAMDDSIIFEAIEKAEAEMMLNGIVAVGDISNSTSTLFQKRKHNIHYHNFIEAMGSDPTRADNNFAYYKSVYREFEKYFPKNQISISPHAPYSVSSLLWEKILRFDNPSLFTIHNQETAAENLWFQRKTGEFVTMFSAMSINTAAFSPTGKTSLQSYLDRFSSGQQLLLVHNVCTIQEDINFANKQTADIFWCFCPNANWYISRSLPNVDLFIKNDCPIVLGTDSLASNYSLSIWEEIKTIKKHFPETPTETMLQWATINGAKALRIDDQFGSFEKGKKPGLVNIIEDTAKQVRPKQISH